MLQAYEAIKPTSIQELLEAIRQKQIITPKMIHPGTRPKRKSYTRREQMRRNRAVYGKRKIRLDIGENSFVIDRDFHMPQELRKSEELRSIETLEAYQHALFTSGYRLYRALGPNQSSLIYQYEGRTH